MALYSANVYGHQGGGNLMRLGATRRQALSIALPSLILILITAIVSSSSWTERENE